MSDERRRAQAQQKMLYIQPIVVPRAYDPREKRLDFSVVFNFVDLTQKGGPRSSGPDEAPLVPACLSNKEKPWPSFILELFRDDKCLLFLQNGDKIRTWSKIHVKRPPDLEWANWRWEKSDKLWKELVLPSILQREGNIKHFRKRSPLGRLYAPKESARYQAEFHSETDVSVNPDAATDLRPGYRLESLDPQRVLNALHQHKLPDMLASPDARAYTEKGDSLGLELLLTLAETREVHDFLRYLDKRAAKPLADVCRDVVAMYEREDPNFKESILPFLPKNARLKKVMEPLIELFTEYTINTGQFELRRHGRFVGASRNRPAYAEAQAPIGLREAPKYGEKNTQHPSFDELMAQVKQHPGLARRLAVTLFCSVLWDEMEGKDPKKTPVQNPDPIPDGRTWLRVPGDEVCCPFVEPPLVTAVSLVPGGKKETSLFRAKAKIPESFLGLKDNPPKTDQFWRYSVLPTEFYVVSQEDTSVTAARTDQRLDKPPAPDAKTEDKNGLHRVNSVNFYAVPRDPNKNPQTVAQALHERLLRHQKRTANVMEAMHKWVRLSDKDKSEALRRAPQADTVLYAEDLIQGYTIFVRELKDKGRTIGPWLSLCRRMAKLEIYGENATQNEPISTTEFEEEAAISTSALISPRPQVGLVVSAPQAAGPDKHWVFEVQVLDAKNETSDKSHSFQSREKKPDPQKLTEKTVAERQPERTQIASLIGAMDDWNDLDKRWQLIKQWDVVLVTPTGNTKPNNQAPPPADAAELVVHPIFRAQDDVLPGFDVEQLKQGQFLIINNKVPDPKDDTKEINPPSRDQSFSLFVAAHATRFLDKLGNPIPLPDKGKPLPKNFIYFLVEGEKRFYGIPQFQCLTQTAVPFLPIQLGKWPLPEGNRPKFQGVLSRLGPANTLHPLYLNNDAWDRIFVPAPRPNNKQFAEPLGCGDLEQFGRVDSHSSLELVRGRVTDVSFTLTVKLRRVTDPKKVKINPQKHIELKYNDQKKNQPDVAHKDSPPSSEFWGVVEGDHKDEEKTLPDILGPNLKVFLYQQIRAEGPRPAKNVERIVLRMTGTVSMRSGSGASDPCTLVLQAPGYELIKQARDGDGKDRSGDSLDTLKPSLSWRVTVQTSDGHRRTAVYAEPNPALVKDGKPIIKEVGQRFRHPTWVNSCWVELVGVSAGNLLAGRAWPQNLLGTLDLEKKRAHQAIIYSTGVLGGAGPGGGAVLAASALIAEEERSGKLHFSDGSVIKVKLRDKALIKTMDKIANETPITGFFRVELSNDAKVPIPTWIVTDFTAEKEGLLIAGEVIRTGSAEALPDSEGEGRVVELAGLHGDSWTIHWNDPSPTKERRNAAAAVKQPLVVNPTASALAARSLREVQPGEFLIVRCDPDTATARAGWVTPRIDNQNNRLAIITACLLGALKVPPPRIADIVAEGADKYRSCQLMTGQKNQLVVWCQTADTTLNGREVITASSPVIHATTVTRFVHPKVVKRGEADPPDKGEPVHTTVSELIARWTGWSLAVSVPGKTDAPAKTDDEKKIFAIVAFRSDKSGQWFHHPGEDRDTWKLPPLRFDHVYQFCLRRVDLAGNHYYDEGPLPKDLPKSEAIAGLKSLDDDSAVTRVLQRLARRKSGKEAVADAGVVPYRRTDRPAAPLLAYRPDQNLPYYIDQGNTDDTASFDKPFEADTDLKRIVYNRPPLLFLLTDVLPGHASADADAQVELLPPPCSAETVLIYGRYDSKDPRLFYQYAVTVFENHLDYDRFGRYDTMWPNYFGDPAAKAVRIVLKMRDRMLTMKKNPKFYTDDPNPWGQLCLLTLKLTSSLNGDSELPADPSAAASIEFDPVPENQVVFFKIPPGVIWAASLQVPDPDIPIEKPEAEWRSILLVHATNGAWSRPRWLALEEQLPVEVEPVPSTNRTLQGKFLLHRPTTGTYAVSALWNDPWDELVPALCSPATAVAVVENGVVTHVEMRDNGFGFGTQAVVLFLDEEVPKREAILGAVPVNGRIESVTVHGGGDGYSRNLNLRILRRPPFARVAEATATVDENGQIEAVRVTDRGGWYITPPIVVVHDVGGDGYGAQLQARLDHRGGVASVKVTYGGRAYSKNVQIKFYTNRYDMAEQPLPPAKNPDDAGSATITLQQPFGDPRARRVDYVVQLASSFRKYLRDFVIRPNEKPPALDGPDRIRYHVPRLSPPLQVEITSRVRPAAPDVAYLMPAFDWTLLDPSGLDRHGAETFFINRAQGRLVVRRTSLVRIYLYRPWHSTGTEQLGVVVVPAVLNTIRDSGNLSRDDGGADNIATSPEAVLKEPGLLNEPLDPYAIPEAMRRFVSRWGFDPVWREEAFPPLTADHFPRRTPFVTYVNLLELEPQATSSASNLLVSRPVWLALHEVRYDPVKERWYADLRVELTGKDRPLQANPFVQLALVTYQPNGVPGKRVSPVAVCDPYKLRGERTAEITRNSRLRFQVTLRGEFEHTAKDTDFPRRQVLVRLQSRKSSLPDEVVEHLPAGSSSSAASPTPTLAEYELRKSKKGDSYALLIQLDNEVMESTQRKAGSGGRAVLSIEEYEIYPAAESRIGKTGDGLVVVDGRSCAKQLVYAVTLGIAPGID